MASKTKQQNKNEDEKITAMLLCLKSASSEYQKLFMNMFKVNNNLYPVDIFLYGTIQKTLDLVDSFVILFEKAKYLTAISLVRFHFEILLDIYALFLVEKPHELATNIMRGKKMIRNYKDRDGKKMSYSYLTRKFVSDPNNKEFNFKDDFYNKLSHFTHFSSKHIFYGTKGGEEVKKDGEFVFVLGNNEITNSEKEEFIGLMIEITKAQFKYMIGWVETKKLKKV